MTIEQAYNQYAKQLHRSISKLVGSDEDAQDILQDVFLRAFNNWDKRNPFSPIKWWLESIAKNLAIDHLRHKQMHQFVGAEDVHLIDGATNCEQELILSDQLNAIKPCISKLSPRQKEVYSMYVIDRSTISDISKKLNLTEKVVKMYLNRAKKRLIKLVS